MYQHLIMARVASVRCWLTENAAVLALGEWIRIDDACHRCDVVQVFGVPRGGAAPPPPRRHAGPVIIDLTSTRDRIGPARLLDMAEGRSKQVFKPWLARAASWRAADDVVVIPVQVNNQGQSFAKGTRPVRLATDALL